MLLSFVVPVYNNASAFAECVSSVRVLLDDGVAEVVAVDDGSDEPLRFEAKGVRVIRIGHSGAAVARNVAIGAAEGDFVWPLDADDVIVTDGIGSLLNALRAMPEKACFFHIGNMLAQERPGAMPPASLPDEAATAQGTPMQRLYPRSSIIDHTTNIIRCSWLASESELRYPAEMSLLEDTVFALKVCERAELCLYNDTFRFYCRRTYHPSATAGAWSSERSSRFVDDICRFFRFLGEYADRHSEYDNVRQLSARLRYVYRRVAMVKGCPWSDLVRMLDVVGQPRCPILFYRFTAFVCRLLRPKR